VRHRPIIPIHGFFQRGGVANTGRSFEIEVRDFIDASLKAGEWGFDPKLVVVRHKAKYWSDKRQSHIITDVSVEIRKPKQQECWFLWVIECKDIGKLVPVDDVEEFHSKMVQINAHKGTMVSRLGFGKGCRIPSACRSCSRQARALWRGNSVTYSLHAVGDPG
jgi:hypothetical protein